MPTANALELAADIVSSFVQRNEVAPGDLPDLIQSVHQAIATAGGPEVAPADA